ncbi:MAG: cardiolipin synthase, partial [Oscillospiraceae bacterium]|nr:cardiolipin synthase [Oscillospiraceae bacterium]
NRLFFNYSDHRKILCVDGQYAYTGGVNVADEYVGELIRFGEWKDGGVLLDGPGAWGLTSQFLHMWEMLGERVHREHDYYRPHEERETSGYCQPFNDGPMNNPDNPAEDMYLQCISNAHRYLWVTTPYFAVEDAMVRALCMAADSGVDVRILLPGIPDHKYTQIVAGSYYERLLRHGVKIFEFTPGFLHTKSLVADGEAALLGTINMDYRSFQLHYECGVALYGAPVIGTLERDMREIMERSRAVDAKEWGKRPWFRKMLEKVLRIFSIWM